jgi:predicted aspartyl protease
MGRNFLIVAAAIGLAGASMAVAAASNCKLVRIEEWPVRQERGHLFVDGAVNGRKIGIILDTGAMASLILRSAAVRLGLDRRWLRSFVAFGVGGETEVETGYVEEFKIGQAARKGWWVMVAGERDFGGDAAFLLGEDFFQQADVEFDLAHNAVRLFQPKDCNGVSLAYWATDVAGEAEIDKIDGRRPMIVLTVRINGQPVKAMVDSGASTSLLDKRLAASMGVTPETPGVVAGGRAIGVGKKSVDVWIGRFQSFAIGNETIKDTTVRFADLLVDVPGDVPLAERMPPMVLGLDFLRAHRVLIAHSQRKIYFTYAGGPVFKGSRNLDRLPVAGEGFRAEGEEAFVAVAGDVDQSVRAQRRRLVLQGFDAVLR